MDTIIISTGISFIFAISAVIYFSIEHSKLMDILKDHVRANDKAFADFIKSTSDLRTSIMSQKTEIDQTQEHLAKLREELQRLSRNQKILRERVKASPQEMRIQLVEKLREEKAKAPVLPRGNPKDVKHEGPIGIASYSKIKEITQQLKELSV